MEIVIENPSSDSSVAASTKIPSPNSAFPSHHHRPYRASYVAADPVAAEYYSTLQRPRSRLVSPEPDYESGQIATSVRRTDRSGLLVEVAEPDLGQRARSRLQTNGDNLSGTLTRRIDRSGLLEAVPELPDQLPGWRTPEKTVSINERKLTGAEYEKNDDNRPVSSPRRSPIAENLEIRDVESRSRISPTSNLRSDASSNLTSDVASNLRSDVTSNSRSDLTSNSRSDLTSNSRSDLTSNMTSSISSPYLRRYPGESPNSNLERPTPVLVTSTSSNTHRNSFTCVSPSATKFLPIDALPPRSRQSYVDLTGATYTRSSGNSPLTISTPSGGENSEKKPDCIGRSSPRSRDRQSPLTMSAIPDVIEAHGSRAQKAPEGERAEAEGCEHTAIESLEETRVSFKAPNKILHNDNIQTLRVIILSEQL